MKHGKLLTILYCTALVSFTAYVMLDTFVLTRSYQTDATEMNTDMFSSETDDSSQTETSADSETTEAKQTVTNTVIANTTAAETSEESEIINTTEDAGEESGSSEIISTENTYQDENISITLTEYYENNTKIYAADIQLNSAQYLKTAFADDTYGRNITETTSDIASAHNAILAINGDYYGAQESGCVIRNGVAYRDVSGREDGILCIYADGSMEITDASGKTADDLISEGVWQAFSFGPGLVENGSVSVSKNEEVGKAMASNPRTAIGITADGHFVFVVADGRTSESEGLSLYELAVFMQEELGVTTAYNLDGGGSSTMYFQGEVVNNPTTNGRHIEEREVSDIVYIG